jgi:hypothetical protein
LSLPVSGAFDPFLRVIMSGGALALAGANDDEIGVLNDRAIGPPQFPMAAVIPQGDPAQRDGVASAAILQYAYVYAAANGQLGPTGTPAQLRGLSMTAAAGAGSWFQYLPFKAGSGATY